MSTGSRKLRLATLATLLGGIALQACNTEFDQLNAGFPLLVSASWVADRLGDSTLVLIHVGSRDEYDQGHIPGARYLMPETILLTSARGLRSELPPVAQLDSVFEDLGVSDESHVVLYHGERGLSMATRTFFTLDYLGFGNRTSVMDGGMQAWRAEGRETTADVSDVTRGSLTPRPRPEVVTNAEWISAKLADPGVA
jgi:thiosulfate/3-mercaptopyruvate sulfurtransferase